jgi:hypothetical protein
MMYSFEKILFQLHKFMCSGLWHKIYFLTVALGQKVLEAVILGTSVCSKQTLLKSEENSV